MTTATNDPGDQRWSVQSVGDAWTTAGKIVEFLRGRIVPGRLVRARWRHIGIYGIYIGDIGV